MLTGNLGGLRIVILKNKYKKSEKHPDYCIFVDENQPKEKAQNEDDDLSETELAGDLAGEVN